MSYRGDTRSNQSALQRRARGRKAAGGGALQRRRQQAIAGARNLQLRRDYPQEGRGARSVRTLRTNPEAVTAALARVGRQVVAGGGRLQAQPDWDALYREQIMTAMRADFGGNRYIEIRAQNPGGDGIDMTWVGGIRFYVDREHPAQQEAVRSQQAVGSQSGGTNTSAHSRTATTTHRDQRTRELEVHGEGTGSRTDSAGVSVPVEGVGEAEASSERSGSGTLGGSYRSAHTEEDTQQQQDAESQQQAFSGQAAQSGNLGTTESFLEATIMAEITLRAEVTAEEDPGLLDAPWEYGRRLGTAVERLRNPEGPRSHREAVACGTVKWLDTSRYHSTEPG